ncbi:MAG: potassium transporter [Burkholderiales bacterium RIFCSPLOWO2_02_FULL_57_36]|nr:MAG: potassium transporter [Burkholderiales bacterium RIFCSPLOWO2_02_FULL_57_36]
MQEQHALPFLRETLLFLALAGILIPLLQRLRINQIVGFLAAGIVVGPFGLGLWVDRIPELKYFTVERGAGVNALAELGVLFLMFMIGLELPATRLWSLKRWVFAGGISQIALSAVIIGVAAFFFGNRAEAAVVLGLVLSLSSTAVVMQLLTERQALNAPLGQASFSILMLQDLAVVPLFILLSVMAEGEISNLVPLLGITLLKSIAAIALIYLLGRRVIRPLFQLFARQRQPDVFMAITLLSALGIAAVTSAAGLSMALGAFLAGLLLAETEYRHEVDVTIEPFKGLLMGLFFMSVGMQIDLRQIADSPLWIPLSVIGLFAIKASVMSLVFRVGGFSWGRSVEGGLLMGQGGEFAFIIIGYALAVNLLDPAVGQFMMLVVGFSLFATPPAARLGRAFGDWWERRHQAQAADLFSTAGPQLIEGHVIIAGFGRVGQLLAQILTAQGIRYVALESDARLVGELRSQDMPVYFGNAARTELLRKLHADRAAAIVLTMDHVASTLHAARAIRRECPGVPLFARARDEKHALAVKKAGATLVIPETLETSLQLSALVLQTLGMAEIAAAHVIQGERDRRISLLQK